MTVSKIAAGAAGEGAGNNPSVGRERRRLRLLANLPPMVLALGLAGCSSVPDAVNPVEWYRSAVDAFDDEEQAEQGAAETAETAETEVPGANDEFPSLSTVPERPSADGNVAEGLVADPNAPKYSDAVGLQGDDDSSSFPTVATEAPEMPSVPVEEVESAGAQQVATVEPAAPEPSVAAPAEPVIGESGELTEMASVPTQQKVSTPLVVEPGRLPSGETYDEYRARLMQGLGGSGGGGFAPVTDFSSTGGGDSGLGTVVVSSTGIEQDSGYTGSGGMAMAADASGMSDAGFHRLDGSGGLIGPGSVKVATIHFSNGSDNLDSRDMYVLRQVAALHAESGGVVRIIGHASSRTASMDEVRHKLVNYRVSAQRADAVAKQLVRLGLPKDMIYVGAASDTNPVYLEVMPTGEAGNRRAEIYIDS